MADNARDMLLALTPGLVLGPLSLDAIRERAPGAVVAISVDTCAIPRRALDFEAMRGSP